MSDSTAKAAPKTRTPAQTGAEALEWARFYYSLYKQKKSKAISRDYDQST